MCSSHTQLGLRRALSTYRYLSIANVLHINLHCFCIIAAAAIVRSRSFAACARVLKGGAPPPLRESTCRPSSAAMYAVCQAQATHAEFWPVRLLNLLSNSYLLARSATPLLSETWLDMGRVMASAGIADART